MLSIPLPSPVVAQYGNPIKRQWRKISRAAENVLTRLKTSAQKGTTEREHRLTDRAAEAGDRV